MLRGLFNGFVPPGMKRTLVNGGVEVTEAGQGHLPTFYVEVKRAPSGRTYVGNYDPADELDEELDEEEEERYGDGPVEDSTSDEIDIIVEGSVSHSNPILPDGITS